MQQRRNATRRWEMTHKGSLDTSGEGERAQQGDARARWDRPALQRLSAIDAEILTKKAQDDVQGKGFYS